MRATVSRGPRRGSDDSAPPINRAPLPAAWRTLRLPSPPAAGPRPDTTTPRASTQSSPHTRPPPASWPTAALHLVTAIIGAGVLTLPNAVSWMGWLFGMPTILIFYLVRPRAMAHASASGGLAVVTKRCMPPGAPCKRPGMRAAQAPARRRWPGASGAPPGTHTAELRPPLPTVTSAHGHHSLHHFTFFTPTSPR